MGKKLICFIDDMNMPQVDEYGTQQPIALLKLLFEKQGFYDRGKDLNWKKLRDISYFAAMGVAGGGRNDVDPRFMSKFTVFNLAFPSENTLQHVYTSILTGHLKIFEEEVMIADVLVRMTLNLYKILIVELPPTPNKFHYIFNMRDLSRICAGICCTVPKFYTAKHHIVRLWRNEFTRVVCDRLINIEDGELMRNHIIEQITEYFPSSGAPTGEPKESATQGSLEGEGLSVSKSLTQTRTPSETAKIDAAQATGEIEGTQEQTIDILEYSMREPLLFGDYRNAVNEEEPRFYEDLLDYEAIYFLFQEIMDEYNERKEKMNLVLFNDALEHLTRIHRYTFSRLMINSFIPRIQGDPSAKGTCAVGRSGRQRQILFDALGGIHGRLRSIRNPAQPRL